MGVGKSEKSRIHIEKSKPANDGGVTRWILETGVSTHSLAFDTGVSSIQRGQGGLGRGKNVTKLISVRPTDSKAKQYQNMGVWSRESFIAGPCKETGGSCLKKTRTPRKLSAKPFYRKGEGGAWLVVANFLMSDSSFLRSGHGKVTMFL